MDEKLNIELDLGTKTKLQDIIKHHHTILEEMGFPKIEITAQNMVIQLINNAHKKLPDALDKPKSISKEIDEKINVSTSPKSEPVSPTLPEETTKEEDVEMIKGW